MSHATPSSPAHKHTAASRDAVPILCAEENSAELMAARRGATSVARFPFETFTSKKDLACELASRHPAAAPPRRVSGADPRTVRADMSRPKTTGSSTTPARFDAAALVDLDEPVRRYFTHALADGARLSRGARLQLRGHIKVGAWLRFDSVWEGDARSFSWRATCGAGPLPLLRVHDQLIDGVGFMDIRLRLPLSRLPGLKLLHADNDDVARSGAGRAALEAPWVPGALLPERGVSWRAESEELIVATWDVPPEKPQLRISVGLDGAVRSYSALRWRSRKSGYLPFGADVHAERTFAGVTISGQLTAGWGHGTPKWAPFFKSEVIAVELID